MERDKDKTEVKNSKHDLQRDVKLIPPEIRLEQCFDMGANFSFEVNHSITR